MKYLTIMIAGHNKIVAFENLTREGQQPHFKADGVAVWINEKKEKVE